MLKHQQWFSRYQRSIPVDPGLMFLDIKNYGILRHNIFHTGKKQSHISTLHIFGWITVKFAPVIADGFFAFINCFVHVIMYAYYIMSTYPKLVPYLWWKKYLTRIQMVQFVLVILNAMRIFLMQCDFPTTFLYLNSFFAFF